jgi:glycosyltransferase involved in cell wall biosynthesis
MIRTAALTITAPPLRSSFSEPLPKPDGVLGRLIRRTSRLAQLRDSQPPIRGSGVAIDNLVHMMTRELQPLQWMFYLPPQAEAATRDWLASSYHSSVPVNTSSFPALATDAIDDTALDVWLDPGGAMPLCLRLRNSYSREPYPVISVQHTLSPHVLLALYFPSLISETTYPWDTAICSTKASATSFRSLLQCARQTHFGDIGEAPNYRGRIEVIPLPVDTETFAPGDRGLRRRALHIPAEAFVILYLGHVSPSKADLRPFLAPLKEVVRNAKRKQVLFIVAGTSDSENPEYDACLRKRIAEESLDQTVLMWGSVPASEKLHLYQAADVFFSPSDTLAESFGLTPVEAMACGVPQLVSDWDGYRETVVQGQTGFRIDTIWAPCDGDLISSGDVLGSAFDHLVLAQSVAVDLRQWKERLLQLMENAELRMTMAEASRRRALEAYSYRAVGRLYSDLMEELALCRANAGHTACPPGQARRAHYYDCFGHYATLQLREDTKLEICDGLGPSAGDAATREWQVIGPRQTLDVRSLRSILGLLEKGAMTVGELYGSQETASASAVANMNRHIMWLIKFGIVKPTFQ